MLRRMLQAAFSWAVALVILFEEWGWEPLERAFAKLAHLPFVAAFERWVAALPPRGALAAFALPLLALLPVKLFALWLIAHGHSLYGLTFVLLAKLVGTAATARLFALTRPALMRMAWVARLYRRWIEWTDVLLARVRASAAWRTIGLVRAAARALAERIKSNFNSWRSNK